MASHESAFMEPWLNLFSKNCTLGENFKLFEKYLIVLPFFEEILN